MSKKDSYCEDCGADYSAGEECKCAEVAAEMDPARELDAVEVLISVAKKALAAIEAVHEEDEGPMAMPTPLAEDLRQAIFDLEDIWTFLPPDVLTALRLEMYTAYFNAEAYNGGHPDDEPVANEAVSQLVYPCDDEDEPLAADPDTIGKFTAESQEDLAKRSIKRVLATVDLKLPEKRALTIAEVIERYEPDVMVRCPFVKECTEVDFGEYKTCPHSDWHRVNTTCLEVCSFHDYPHTNCKPMEEAEDESEIL